MITVFITQWEMTEEERNSLAFLMMNESTWIFPFPKVLWPTRTARPLSCRAPAKISLALALPSLTYWQQKGNPFYQRFLHWPPGRMQLRDWKVWNLFLSESGHRNIIGLKEIKCNDCAKQLYRTVAQIFRQLLISLYTLTSTTRGSCVIAWPSTMLMGNIFPSRSIVCTRVSSPSSHIWATSSPAATNPPCKNSRKKKIHGELMNVCAQKWN